MIRKNAGTYLLQAKSLCSASFLLSRHAVARATLEKLTSGARCVDQEAPSCARSLDELVAVLRIPGGDGGLHSPCGVTMKQIGVLGVACPICGKRDKGTPPILVDTIRVLLYYLSNCCTDM